MIVKEWSCLAHGAFDGTEPSCPFGCKGQGMVQRAFRTPPTIQSQGYRTMNNTFENLARDQGLSNLNNRSAIQDGMGMRMADSAAHQRLAQATEMIMGSSRSGLQGTDASEYFKPLNNFRPGSTGEGGVIHRVGDTVMAGNVPLPSPKPKLEAPAFNGQSLGLPAGDA